MIERVADNSLLRLLLLLFLFATVAASGYFIAQAFTVRQLARRRLIEASVPGSSTPTMGSLRTEKVESAWLKLVNSIERRGLSLVDTKDAALRQRLIAAGYTATYAPRIYTLLRLALIVALPLLVLVMFWIRGSS